MLSIENPSLGGAENKRPESLAELIGSNPDAIIIVSGASKFNEKKGRYEMGSYNDVDDSGLVTGGKDRDIAGAELYQAFPESTMVTTSRNMDPSIPTYASIQKGELIRLGVPEEKIFEESESYRTVDGLKNTLLMAQDKGWGKLVYVTSPYHVPRVQAFLERIVDFSSDEGEKTKLQQIREALTQGKMQVRIVSSDEILPFRSKHYETYFDAVKGLEGYSKREESEQKGVDDIYQGRYKYTGKK